MEQESGLMPHHFPVLDCYTSSKTGVILYIQKSVILGSVFGFGGLLALSDRWHYPRYNTRVERREGETNDEFAARREQARLQDKKVHRKYYWGFSDRVDRR